MGVRSENVALVTQTLVGTAGRALDEPRRLDLTAFQNFCALCEAVVLLDRMVGVDSSEPWQSQLGTALTSEGLYATFTPTLSDMELRRLSLRLPAELAGRVRTVTSPPARRLKDDKARLDYSKGLQDLIEQVDRMPRWASAGSKTLDRMYRANGYLILAAAHGLDYFPDVDRVPYVAGTLLSVYRSLPVEVYARVAAPLMESLQGGNVVAEWTSMPTVPVPPVAALVLSRSATLADVPEQLLRLRTEFASFRKYFGEFKQQLLEADTIRERTKLLRKYQALLGEASGPHHESISVGQMINMAEQVVAAAAAPALPTSYGALLLTQPAEWLTRWWRRRPLVMLFRLDSQLPRLSEYRLLVDRLWGADAGRLLLEESTDRSRQFGQLLAETEGK